MRIFYLRDTLKVAIHLLAAMFVSHNASAAIAFGAEISPWGAFGSNPQTSASFTPSAGDTILVVNFDGGSGSRTLQWSGSVNTPIDRSVTLNDTSHGNTVGLASVLSATGGAQTLTVTSVGAGGFMVGLAIRYSGVGSATYSSNGNGFANVTTGVGNSVVVPVGSVLVALCISGGASAGPLTAQANGGVTPTSRGGGTYAGNEYRWAEWVGTGGSITPTFDYGVSPGNLYVFQALLSPPGSSAPSTGILLQQMTKADDAANDEHFLIASNGAR